MTVDANLSLRPIVFKTDSATKTVHQQLVIIDDHAVAWRGQRCRALRKEGARRPQSGRRRLNWALNTRTKSGMYFDL